MSYLLKTPSELRAAMENLEDRNYGLSFLFYSICQKNTLEYKGATQSLVKRLVGSQLFELVPMRKFKKAGESKAVYQYNQAGSQSMAAKCVDAGVMSISELLGVEFVEGSDKLSNDHFPAFCQLVDDYLGIKQAQLKAEKEASEQDIKDAHGRFISNAETANVSLSDFKVMVKAYESNLKAMETMAENGFDTDILGLVTDKLVGECSRLCLDAE